MNEGHKERETERERGGGGSCSKKVSVREI